MEASPNQFIEPIGTRRNQMRAEAVRAIINGLSDSAFPPSTFVEPEPMGVIERTEVAQQEFIHVTEHGWDSEGNYL